MREGVTVIHIMADGTICKDLDDLRAYIKSPAQLSETTMRLLREFIKVGYEALEKQ